MPLIGEPVIQPERLLPIREADRPSLTSRLKGFSDSQARYLLLRAIGLQYGAATKDAGIGYMLPIKWRADVEGFRLLEDELTTSSYSQEARKLFVAYLQPKALLALDKLMDKAMLWDEQDKSDKTHLMRAIELVLRMTDLANGSSYEEIIFKARRTLNAT